MKNDYTKENFLQLLKAYAILAYKMAVIEDSVGKLIADPLMVKAIQLGVWTPPAPPQ